MPPFSASPVIPRPRLATVGGYHPVPAAVPPPVQPVTDEDRQWAADESNPVRLIAFWFGLALIFLRLTLLHELSTFLLGVNLYPLYIIGPPALLGVVFSGGLRRTFRARAPYYWIAFTVWIFLATPFSSWPGGSTDLALGYLKTELPLMFVIAGLTVTWNECRWMLTTFALSGIVNLLTGRLFTSTEQWRVALSFGSFANSNDFAAHLLLILPFLLFFALGPRRLFVTRLVALAAIAFGMYMIVGSASRGAVIALAVSFCIILLLGTRPQKFAVLLMIPLSAVLIGFMPKATLDRLRSDTTTETGEEATESKESRVYLLETSLKFTAQHPIFGVGPGQFSSFEGKTSIESGKRGSWHETHNVYTQISSECGIPALIFYLGGIVSSLLVLLRTYRTARQHPEFAEIATATFCMIISIGTFSTAIFFLTMGYRFYLPALAGLTVAVTSAAQREFNLKLRQAPVPVPATSFAQNRNTRR